MLNLDTALQIAGLSNRLQERGTWIAVAHDGQYAEVAPGESVRFQDSELGCWIKGPATAGRIIEELHISEEVARDEEEPYVGILGEAVN